MRFLAIAVSIGMDTKPAKRARDFESNVGVLAMVIVKRGREKLLVI